MFFISNMNYLSTGGRKKETQDFNFYIVIIIFSETIVHLKHAYH